MTLAQALHERIYQMPRGYAQTAMLWAIRPEWDEESLRTYLAPVPKEEMTEAFVALARALAEHR